jgi:hypothetical protein
MVFFEKAIHMEAGTTAVLKKRGDKTQDFLIEVALVDCYINLSALCEKKESITQEIVTLPGRA